jgi:hypothetical protein
MRSGIVSGSESSPSMPANDCPECRALRAGGEPLAFRRLLSVLSDLLPVRRVDLCLLESRSKTKDSGSSRLDTGVEARSEDSSEDVDAPVMKLATTVDVGNFSGVK